MVPVSELLPESVSTSELEPELVSDETPSTSAQKAKTARASKRKNLILKFGNKTAIAATR